MTDVSVGSPPHPTGTAAPATEGHQRDSGSGGELRRFRPGRPAAARRVGLFAAR